MRRGRGRLRVRAGRHRPLRARDLDAPPLRRARPHAGGDDERSRRPSRSAPFGAFERTLASGRACYVPDPAGENVPPMIVDRFGLGCVRDRPALQRGPVPRLHDVRRARRDVRPQRWEIDLLTPSARSSRRFLEKAIAHGELRRLNELKGQFAALASHELALRRGDLRRGQDARRARRRPHAGAAEAAAQHPRPAVAAPARARREPPRPLTARGGLDPDRADTTAGDEAAAGDRRSGLRRAMQTPRGRRRARGSPRHRRPACLRPDRLEPRRQRAPPRRPTGGRVRVADGRRASESR